MAVSTAGTYLEYSTDNWVTPVILANITNYPDFGSAPNKLDSSHLGLTVMKTNILGLQEVPDYTFEAIYDETQFDTINGLSGVQALRVRFASGEKFTWSGEVMAYVNGAGVDEVRKMTVVASGETVMVKS